MGPPDRVYEVLAALGGTLLDWTNTTTRLVDVRAATFSSGILARIEISVNAIVVNAARSAAGSTHTWWAASGQAFLEKPLAPGDRLLVTVDAGPATLVIDWGNRGDLAPYTLA